MTALRPSHPPHARSAALLPALRGARLPWLLALAAALVLALAPTLSRALTSTGQGAAWAQVCTPQGLQDTPGDNAPPGSTHADACVFCMLAAGAAPAPASTSPWLQPRIDRLVAVDAGTPAVFQLHWQRAAPRGPPARG